jgi:hypothetical protein
MASHNLKPLIEVINTDGEPNLINQILDSNNIKQFEAMIKLEIIETPDYILAISDKKTLSVNGDYFLDYVNNNLHRWSMTGMHKDKSVWINKIIAYQPKSNAPELDLPLLPEIVVEDDVEKLFEEETKTISFGVNGKQNPLYWFNKGHKAATKVYSEEDLREAIRYGFDVGFCSNSSNKVKNNPQSEDDFTQSLKQPKTPKWFVAETEYNCCNRYQNCKGCDTTAEMINLRLKTTTINGKTYLKGKYLNSN